MPSAERVNPMDWVKLNYVNLENNRIKPVTIHIPQSVLDEFPEPYKPPVMVVMMSQLRRKFNDARTQGKQRLTRDRK
jgi:hypothetical protein